MADREEMAPHVGTAEHAGADAVARYLDGSLEPAQRESLERHLGDCEECRDDLVEAGVTMRRLRNRRYVMIVVPVAAAAMLAMLVSLTVGRAPERPDDYRADEQTAIIRVVEPVAGAQVAADSVHFVWSVADAVGATFVLSVTDSAGGLVQEIMTSDTAVFLPRDSLSAGPGSFFWFVDALFENGRSAKSSVNRFLLP